MSDQPPYISLGGGTKLLSEEHYINATGRTWTREGFRRLCTNLGVPMIEIGRERYVDSIEFEIAIASISRIGQPDFYTPGCTSIVNRYASPTKLDTETLRSNWKDILRSLLYRRHLHKADTTHEIRTLLNRGSQALIDAALHELPGRASRQLREQLNGEEA